MSQTPNPPAFPVPNDANVNGQEGMSLRDWFAGQALAGLSANRGFQNAVSWHTKPDNFTAATAYALADTMLATRTAQVSA